jgi:hypothetical protein
LLVQSIVSFFIHDPTYKVTHPKIELVKILGKARLHIKPCLM